jgi:hypothetical protein
MARGTHCVIGAGMAGLAATRALVDRGVDVHVYEAKPDVGGNWLDGVYDSTHLITSRASTGFPEFPMPADWPDFPHHRDVGAYLRAYADHFELRPMIRFRHEIVSVRPAAARDGTDGWHVTYRDEEGVRHIRHYAGVVVANGHHWDARTPHRPGTFSGRQLHAGQYRNTDDLVGPRVLVVGAGNSACDLVVEAAQRFGRAWVSMRRTNHFMPKTLFGKPITDMTSPWLPTWVQRQFARVALRVVHGPYARYGMPEPDHALFSRPTTINSQLMYAMRHGSVSYRPDIDHFDGRAVHFTDGRVEQFDTVVWATGYHVSFPFLAPDLLSWTGEVPRRVLGLGVPGLAGLYLFGLIQLRGGAGPLLSRSAELLADMVDAQSHRDRPVADEVAVVRPADSRFFVSVGEMIRQVYLERRLMAGYRAAQRVRRRWTPAEPLLSGTEVTRVPATTPARP